MEAKINFIINRFVIIVQTLIVLNWKMYRHFRYGDTYWKCVGTLVMINLRCNSLFFCDPENRCRTVF